MKYKTMTMNKLTSLLVLLVLISCKEKGLDTKFIAAKYYQGVVKVVLFDPELEKIEAGKGYLSRGSGFIVTEDGYLFTNKHVVETSVRGYLDYDITENNVKKSTISVYSDEIVQSKDLLKVYNAGYTVPVIQVFHGQGENDYDLYIAEVISIGTGTYDGAMLKIVSDMEGNPVHRKFTTVPIGNSDNVSQGEKLCVYGYPAQYKGNADLMMKDLSTISVGIMSGNDYVLNSDYGYIKTDAEIHPGNSGGPVFNEENKVIGIATAKGRSTGIGLVGGINGMYYISAIDSKAHSKLIANGLSLPSRSSSINTVKGTQQPIKTVKEINDLIAARTKKPLSPPSTSTGDYYVKSQIFFSHLSPAKNENLIPNKTKRYKSFNIDKTAGGTIWFYVDNYPNKLNTSKISVLIDKETSPGVYTKYRDFAVTVNPSHDIKYFDVHFYDEGKFRIRAYSNELKYINTSYLTLSYFK
ncbi:hypothetical protein C5O00_03800 [Pukyongia salina]|uniref:Trypsin-like peptidase domain-containing protein n=1 Tax=Pukyongia salina TaxID=2094025 RepID=A0A2S0HUV7_9FLAO|nr:serine protease [Pukyongia salina]AVI50334.1 hypothetical protein C5O00_03800 [Pukyongia salina]